MNFVKVVGLLLGSASLLFMSFKAAARRPRARRQSNSSPVVWGMASAAGEAPGAVQSPPRTSEEAYNELVSTLAVPKQLERVSAVIHWDSMVTMPQNDVNHQQRALQSAALAGVCIRTWGRGGGGSLVQLRGGGGGAFIEPPKTAGGGGQSFA